MDGRARTMLEQLLRDRRQTPEEFCEEAERYAANHVGVFPITARHLQRLVAGQRGDGRPLGPVRPATRRLLEGMLGIPIERLLSPPKPATVVDVETTELRARLAASRNIDEHSVGLFQQKLDLTRLMDRRLGAPTLLGELRNQIEYMEQALHFTLGTRVHSSLAKVLVDARTLAGWQSLDQGRTIDAWTHYDNAKSAARDSGDMALLAYATAAQSVVLLDIGETAQAVEIADSARTIGRDSAPSLLKAWLNASYGEACAADGRDVDSLLAFDEAARAMPSILDPAETPYLVFGDVHLERWRGNALARLGARGAIDTLSETLSKLEPSFTRAETALRVDLVQVLKAMNDRAEMAVHAERANMLALQIGSVRQRNRLAWLTN